MTVKARKQLEVKSSNISQTFNESIKIAIVQKGDDNAPETRKFLARRITFNTQRTELSFLGPGQDIAKIPLDQIKEKCDVSAYHDGSS